MFVVVISSCFGVSLYLNINS